MAFKDMIEHYTGDIDDWNSQDYTGNGTLAEISIAKGAKWLIDLVANNTPGKLPLFTLNTTSGWSSYAFTLGGTYMEYFTTVYLTHADSTVYECTQIAPDKARQAADVNSIYRATANSPVYYVSNSKISVLPASGTPSVDAVTTLTTGSFDVESATSLTGIPDSYESIIILYAAGKVMNSKLAYYQDYFTIDDTASHTYTALNAAKTDIGLAKVGAAEIVTQTANSGDFEAALDAMNTELDKADEIISSANTEFAKTDALLTLGEADTETAVNTALLLLVTAVAQAASAADKFIVADSDSVFGDEETYLTANSQLTRVKDAVDKVKLLIEGDKPASSYDAHDLLQEEDIELLNGNLAIVRAELDRAQVHISEWNAIGDMRVKEIQAALAEADGQTKHIQTRLSQAQAKREEANSRISAGNAYLQQAQAIIGQAQGYAGEAGARGAFTNAKMQAVQSYLNTASQYLTEFQQRFAKETTVYQWLQGQKQLIAADLMAALTAKGLAGQPAQQG